MISSRQSLKVEHHDHPQFDKRPTLLPGGNILRKHAVMQIQMSLMVKTQTLPRVSARRSSPADRVATPVQKERALWVCGAIVLITAWFASSAATSWPLIPAFLPAYQTTIILAYCITSYLTFAHYRATRSTALLFLCGGCVYTGAILVAQFASFAGMFLPGAPLLGGTQTTIWLWFFWHLGPPAGILFSGLRGWLPAGQLRNISRNPGLFGVSLIVLIGASIATATVFRDDLPILDVGGNFNAITTTGIAPALEAITVAALILLWRVTKFRTVLQIWMGVAVVALICDNAITMLGAQRLSVGWYVGRINGLISAAVILAVYLSEINRAYFQSVNDANDLAVSNSELETMVDEARVDQLTDLPGRAMFLEEAGALLARSEVGGSAIAVLFVDLDGFKRINDQFGHGEGDIVLAQTAAILRSSLREGDLAGRLGGDEFVVCIAAPLEVLEQTAKDVAHRIVSKVSDLGNGIGCSVGIALSRSENPDLISTIRHADEAMYLAKKRGKNRFVLHGRPSLVAVA